VNGAGRIVNGEGWAVEAEGLWREFGAAPALRDVRLRVAWGERVALLGPNGAGKTTLLKVLATLLRPTSGWARVGGWDTAAAAGEVRRRLGFVGHQTLLYPDLTVEENLRFYAALNGAPPSGVEPLLRGCGLWGRRRERVGALSRGQQQRAAVARALVHDPPLLLLDEPDAGLDEAGLDWLEHAIQGGGRTVLLVSQAPQRARTWCPRVVRLDGGRVLGESPEGSPDGGEVARDGGGG
jgi:ABC-type multidrug transport system ATPase subunit